MKDKKVLFVAHVDGHIQAFHIPYLKLFSFYFLLHLQHIHDKNFYTIVISI